MRFAKPSATIAAVAAAVIVLLAPSLSMAESTALCSSNEEGQETCGKNLVELVHYVDPAAKFLLGKLTITCTVLFLGTALGLASPVVVHGNFTYSNCGKTCEVTEVSEISAGGTIKVLKTTATEGTFSGEGFEIFVYCKPFVNCVYGLKEIGGGMTSAKLPATAGKMVAVEQTLERVGVPFICPTTAKLDATLESLTDIYIKK